MGASGRHFRMRFGWVLPVMAIIIGPVCAAAAPPVGVAERSEQQVDHAPAPSADLDGVLAVVSPRARGFLIIPSLKVCSDEITRCLEGMDRAELLLGSRPLDQLKSTLGLTVGIDDLGGAAVVGFERAMGRPDPLRDALDPNAPAQPAPELSVLIIVPVKDAQQFLTVNFRNGDDVDQFIMADGRRVYAKSLASHVVIGPEAELVRGYDPAGGMAGELREQSRAWSMMPRGEIVLFARGDALLKALPAQAKGMIVEPGESTLICLDFDPLGAVIRSLVMFDAEGETGRRLVGGPNRGASLSRLPLKAAPYYLAASIDIAGLGGPEALSALAAALGLPPAAAPEWLAQARSVQFAVYPGPAGISGGVLNDATLVIETPNPQAVRAAIKSALLTMNADQERPDGVQRAVQWVDDKPIKDGLVADAYEVRLIKAPPEMASAFLAQSLLFGNAGWRGFVKTTDDALIMTFSQRPAVLSEALAAAGAGSAPGADAEKGAAEPVAAALAADPVIQSMRQWLPADCDVEIYLGLGPITKLAQQAAMMFGGGEFGALLARIQQLDPVGLGMKVEDHALESAAVVPASVLAAGFDLAMARAMGPREAPGPEPLLDEEQPRTQPSEPRAPAPAPGTAPAPGGKP